jgi:dihydroneopterin aldolase
MTDRITLRGLRVRGFHGVLPEERRNGQDFVIDSVLDVDISPAAATDDLSRTVNYSDLAHALAGIVAGEPLDLIETLAERLAAACLQQPLVSAVEITVHKPDAPITLPFDDVTVTIRRTRTA